MRRAILMVACGLAVAAACSPLRQPLGSLAPISSTTTTGAADGSSAGTSGSAGSAGVLTGNQIPSLPPGWGTCDPTVFRCFQDPGLLLSSPASGLFGGALDPDPASKPVIVYPLDGAMHPINSADITFQWRRAPGAAQTVFRIRLQRVNHDIFEFFVPCDPVGAVGPPMETECAHHMPPGPWIDAATTARGETLTVEIAGVDLNHPATFSASDPISLVFSPEDVRGGLYYWSSGVTGTERVLFGASAPDSFISHTPPACGGCHAPSRDGATIAFEQGDTGKGVLWVVSTAKPDTPLFTPSTTHDSGTQALNHDGTRVLVSFTGMLILRDARTGMKLGQVDETQLGRTQHAFHPEWSPDDQSIAVTVSAQGDSDWATRTGAIGVLPYNDGQFGPVDIIVPTGTTVGSDFNFYPTWSPDGHFIAFATGKVGAATATPPQTSYDQSTARLRLVDVNTKVVVELAAASGKPGSTTTWPKFAPFAQAGGLMFLTFNAKLDYGFFLPNNAGGAPQLWMTAIDASKPLQVGADPSRAPVWLPFQDVGQRNYSTAWAQTIGCRVDNGTSVGCGDSQVCNAGACAMVAR
jgi:Tol biopolymer transport system component